MEQLPSECLLMVSNYLPRPSLLSLCKTSKTLYDFGMPELYRHIAIKYHSNEDLAFLEHLQQSERKGLWVRSITIRSKYLNPNSKDNRGNPDTTTIAAKKAIAKFSKLGWIQWHTDGFQDETVYRDLFAVAQKASPGVTISVYIENYAVWRGGPDADLKIWDQGPLRKPEQIAFVLPLIRRLNINICQYSPVVFQILQTVLEQSPNLETIHAEGLGSWSYHRPTPYLQPRPDPADGAQVARPSRIAILDCDLPTSSDFLNTWTLAGGSTRLKTLQLSMAANLATFIAACPITMLPALRHLSLTCLTQRDLDENKTCLAPIVNLKTIELFGKVFGTPWDWLTAQRETLVDLTIHRDDEVPAERAADLALFSTLPLLRALSIDAPFGQQSLLEITDTLAQMPHLRHLKMMGLSTAEDQDSILEEIPESFESTGNNQHQSDRLRKWFNTRERGCLLESLEVGFMIEFEPDEPDDIEWYL